MWQALIPAGVGLLGSIVGGNAARDAANTQAQAQREAAQTAADAAKFRPVGVTSRFGSSRFTTDPSGYVTEAGYELSPELKALQDQLMGMTGGLMGQYQGAMGATAPMGEAAQTMMGLGQGYLSTSPQEQAQKYMADQQALLAAGRERELAGLENRLMQQGRLGLATGGTSSGMMAANPELEAYYNAKRQQDLGLAAQATQGGMDYAKFGAGMVGQGGEMLKGMYGTQQAAYQPFLTALSGAQTMEEMGQQPFQMGMNIGAKGMSPAAAQALSQGMMASAQSQRNANAYSPWSDVLKGAGDMLSQYKFPEEPVADEWRF